MLVRLTIAGSAALCLALSGLELAERTGGGLLLHTDPAAHAEVLASQGRWAETRMLAEYLVTRPDLADERRASELLRRSNAELESLKGKLQRFAHGAVTGEPTDLPSMLGSLSLDLFVIGDIRDLAVQGWKQASDGSGDGVILALSAIGLTTTLTPQLDWAPALLKALRRSRALTDEFSLRLSRKASEALSSGDYGDLSMIVSDFGRAAGRLGPGPLRGAMAWVADAHDLSRIARAAEVDARSTYVVAELVGRDGVKAIDRNGGNIGALAASIKTGSRLAKFVKKSTGALPTSWLGLIMAASLGALIVSLYPLAKRPLKAWRASGY